MSDPSGSTSYHFTALSQIASETRTFAGLAGSYTLTYEYTLAGQLKNLADHTNQRVNYSYDKVGRLNNIVGTNYSSNQFITSIKARAWGGSSEIVYGNGLKASFNYNNRLQTEHFQLTTSGGVNGLSLDYEYHDDGRLRYSQNLLNGVFDRSFEHDHVGRLTKALSGAEARGEPATNNRPYKETATYDAFNHLNVRTSLHWSRTLGFASSDTYVDNRRVNWTYDANGNLLSDGQRQHVYDAAGRPKAITWSTGVQFNQFFDADGQRVKTVESNITTYYLRSTVLGGQVIEELNASGSKEKGFIYAGEKRIAHQANNGNVLLEYEDPSGLTVRTSTPQSDFPAYWAELDPWGAEVFTWDPYLADPQFSGGRGEGGPVFPGFADISMPSLCTQLLDGVLSHCDFANRNMNGGGILVERLSRNGTRELLPLNLYLGATWIWREPRSGNSSMQIDYDEHGNAVARTNNSFPGYWEIIAWIIVPQNPKSDCATFVDTLVDFSRQYQHHGEVDIGRGFLAMIPRNQSERERHYAQTRVSGFKDRLVAPVNYQGGWVHAHVLGIAGGTLIGNSTIYPWPFGRQTGSQLVEAQMQQDRKELADVEEMDHLGFALYDYYGQLRPLKDVLTERRSEVASNLAAQEIGGILRSAIRGSRTFDEARKEIFGRLCDH